MHYLGLISLYVSCGFTLLAILVGMRAKLTRPDTARKANLISIVAVAVSTLALVFSFVTNDYRLAYVARNSARSLPLIYKVSGLWAGQSGSLLLWLLIISFFSLAVQSKRGLREQHFDIRINVVINVVRLVFLLILIFVSQPFELLADPPYNGFGLNPMLQSFGMVIHPPLLFVGFSGFLIPFAIVMATFWVGDPSDTWLELVRPWVLFAWVFLTAGTVTGGQWAYNELGWGGYWAWDPVENASLFPWLTGTALLHILLLKQEQASRKLWSYVLIVLTFSLTIFGTFLTRSGVLDSVHAFAGGVLGPIFLAVLVAILLISAWLGWVRKNFLKRHPHDTKSPLISLETAIRLGNILFLLLFVGIFFGTMFPLFSRNLMGREIVLDASFFNQVTVPLFLLVFLLLGLAPVLAKGGVGLVFLLKNTWFPLIVALCVGLYLHFAMGGGTVASLAIGIAVFGLITHLVNVLGTKRGRFKTSSALMHIGVLLMLVGVTGSSVFTDSVFVSVKPGDEIQFGDFQVGYNGLTTRYAADRYTVGTSLSLFRSGKQVGELTSEKTFWENRSQPSTKVGIFSTAKGDLYLNLAGWEGQTAQLQLQSFALIGWIWFGSWVVYLGALLALLSSGSRINLGKQVRVWRKRTF